MRALSDNHKAALTRALSLAPEHALAHLYMGVIKLHTNRATEGIAECEQASALDRSFAAAHGYIDQAMYFIGRGEETETHIQEAFRLSPRDTNAYLWIAITGLAKIYLSSDEEAVTLFRHSIETNWNFPLAHFCLAAALALSVGSRKRGRRYKRDWRSTGLSLSPASATA